MQNVSDTMPTKVLDTYALVAFFAGEPGADFIRGLLLEAEAHKTKLAMSIINLGEVWYSIARIASAKQADVYIEEIRRMSIEIVNADWQLTHQAAIYKSRGGISYADCFAAALAKLRQAELVTADPEFGKVKDEITIVWNPT
jgi:predicted nucleic acid-binding protein